MSNQNHYNKFSIYFEFTITIIFFLNKRPIKTLKQNFLFISELCKLTFFIFKLFKTFDKI